jgi:hypothetical protein
MICDIFKICLMRYTELKSAYKPHIKTLSLFAIEPVYFYTSI